MSERMNPFASSTDPIDHASHRYTRGFRMLTLGWSDGVTFLPVNSCLLSSEKESSRINEGWDAHIISASCCGENPFYRRLCIYANVRNDTKSAFKILMLFRRIVRFLLVRLRRMRYNSVITIHSEVSLWPSPIKSSGSC